MTGTEDAPTREDRVLPPTRALAAAIVPFLVVAFAVLYWWPGETERHFAWTIRPTMTPMVLGAVYIGGAYFFVRAWRATEWHTVKVGFLPVGPSPPCWAWPRSCTGTASTTATWPSGSGPGCTSPRRSWCSACGC